MIKDMGKAKIEKSGKNSEPKIAEISEEKTCGGDIIPSENVLFVGGQENFVNKMKKIYPEWTYLNTEERNSKKVNGNYSLAIIKANHCSHNIIERALAHCKGAPVIYSNCTNVNRTIEEIRSSIVHNNLRFKMYEGGCFLNLNAYKFDIDDFLQSFGEAI